MDNSEFVQKLATLRKDESQFLPLKITSFNVKSEITKHDNEESVSMDKGVRRKRLCREVVR